MPPFSNSQQTASDDAPGGTKSSARTTLPVAQQQSGSSSTRILAILNHFWRPILACLVLFRFASLTSEALSNHLQEYRMTSQSTSTRQQQQQHHQQRHRSLQGLGEVLCRLDDILWFINPYNQSGFLYDADTAYTAATETNGEIHNSSSLVIRESNNGTSGTTTIGTTSNSTASDDDDDQAVLYVAVRRCACADDYQVGDEYQQDYYCLADTFNACLIRGGFPTVQVQCTTSSRLERFLRTYWPVTVAATLALIYALAATFTGRLARQFAKRLVVSSVSSCGSRLGSTDSENTSTGSAAAAASAGAGTSNASTTSNNVDIPAAPTAASAAAAIDTSPLAPATTTAPPVAQSTVSSSRHRSTNSMLLLSRDLDDLLERQPERAAMLYRQYRLRERDRLRRRHARHNSYIWRSLSSCRRRICGRGRRGGRRGQRQNGNGNSSPAADANDSSGMDFGDTTTSSIGISASPSPPIDLRPRLTLKTKLYQVDGDNDNDNGDTGSYANATSAAGNSSAGALSVLFQPRDQVTLEEMDDEMEHGVRCAICLSKLRPQHDVIGDIYCHHAMHKDCLKDWLQRKNQCPLCQQTGIATLTAPLSQLPRPLHQVQSSTAA